MKKNIQDEIEKRPVARANVVAPGDGQKVTFENEPARLDWHDARKASQEIREGAHSSNVIYAMAGSGDVHFTTCQPLGVKDRCHFIDMRIDPSEDLRRHNVALWKN